MRMDDQTFAEYAEELEREDFEEDLLSLSCSVRQLVDARSDTIMKLRASAAYLDSVWLREVIKVEMQRKLFPKFATQHPLGPHTRKLG